MKKRGTAESHKLLLASAGVVLLIVYGLFFISRAESILDGDLKGRQSLLDQMLASRIKPSSPNRGYIIFHPIHAGQGIGNILHGLLAAHVLGREFNRTVCLAKNWTAFHTAFQSKYYGECSRLKQEGGPSLQLLTYGYRPNECMIRNVLTSGADIVHLTANTYPRWPKVVPGLWSEYYEPTQELLRVLPYKEQPEIVVHLRAADNENFDARMGLDPASLDALGNMLPSFTFLVTNNVDWYSYFEENFRWNHPSWGGVRHSALKFMAWGKYKKPGFRYGKDDADELDESRTLELFSDWYTILKAKKVYHTHSDFSLSAIHWNEIDSKTIGDFNITTETVDLFEESWRLGENTIPLSQRTRNSLQNCRGQAQKFQKDDDDGSE